jgi:hypothetical protein
VITVEDIEIPNTQDELFLEKCQRFDTYNNKASINSSCRSTLFKLHKENIGSSLKLEFQKQDDSFKELIYFDLNEFKLQIEIKSYKPGAVAKRTSLDFTSIPFINKQIDKICYSFYKKYNEIIYSITNLLLNNKDDCFMVCYFEDGEFYLNIYLNKYNVNISLVIEH